MEDKIMITQSKRMLIFANLIITSVAGSMLATSLTTALPPIVRDLGISVAEGQWLTSGYSLVMAIMMPLTAFLINRFPSKMLYGTALSIFSAGLFISMVAGSFEVMMAGRIVQAAASGVLTSMAHVVILTIFPAEKRGTAMGWYGLAICAAPIVAPTVAGILADSVGWRAIFGIVLGIMVMSLVYALLVFDDIVETTRKRFDVMSFVLSAAAFGGITLGTGNLGSCGIASLQVIVPFLIGVTGAVYFVKRQLSLDDPFLDIRILRNRNYALSVAGSMLLYFIMMGASIILPIYVQETKGMSATVSGLVCLPGAIASAISGPVAGKIYDRIGMKVLFVSGSVCLFVSSLIMSLITIETSVWFVSFVQIFRALAIGSLMMPLVTWGAGNVEPSKMAHATSLMSSLRTIAGAIGSASVVGIMTAASKSAAAGVSAVSAGAESASIYGIKIAFTTLAITSVIMLILALMSKNTVERINA